MNQFFSFFSFEGRMSRSSFWIFTFLLIAIQFAILILYSVLTHTDATFPTGLNTLLDFISVPLFLCAAARRMHDINKSGFFIFIPILNIICYLLPSVDKDNRFNV